MWKERDSDNLELLARSLAKLADIEQERNLISPAKKESFLQRVLKVKQEHSEISVKEAPALEDTYLEEKLKLTQSAQNKIRNAERSNNMPFFVEDLLDPEELEIMEEN